MLSANVDANSYWFDTTAEFVDGDAADDPTFTVIVNGKLADATMSDPRVQVTVVVPAHENPLALFDDANVIPAGNESVTVVVPTASATAESATVNVYVPVDPYKNVPTCDFANDRSGLNKFTVTVYVVAESKNPSFTLYVNESVPDADALLTEYDAVQFVDGEPPDNTTDPFDAPLTTEHVNA